MKKFIALGFVGFFLAASAHAGVVVLRTNLDTKLSDEKITSDIESLFDVNEYRMVRVQVIVNPSKQPDHYLVHLHKKGFHRVDFARVNLNQNQDVVSVEKNYVLQSSDKQQQPGPKGRAVQCPDPTVQYITACPVTASDRTKATKEAADAVEKGKLKLVQFIGGDSTRENLLNYMSCPNLKGFFYDGDGDPSSITTSDGVITSDDFSSTLASGVFRLEVMNMWVACNSYNDPILSSVQKDGKSKKYAAGITSLADGPADETAACATAAAIEGKPMTQSFNECYDQNDVSSDKWGFGGDGSDLFWK